MTFAEECQLTVPVREYIFEQMESVDGWLSKDEAAMFAAISGVQEEERYWGDLVDLGVWHGRSTILLHRLLRAGELLVAADLFDLRSPDHSHFNDPSEFLSNAERLEALDGRVRMVRVDTSKSLGALRREAAEGTVRLFHVDGGHGYRVVRGDIEFAISRLTTEGVLVCDDVFDRRHAGVTQALIELLQRNRDLVPFALTRRKAWLSWKGAAERYREALVSFAPNSTERSVTFMRATPLLVE